MADMDDIVRELQTINETLNTTHRKNMEWDKKILLATIVGSFALIGIKLFIP